MFYSVDTKGNEVFKVRKFSDTEKQMLCGFMNNHDIKKTKDNYIKY